MKISYLMISVAKALLGVLLWLPCAHSLAFAGLMAESSPSPTTASPHIQKLSGQTMGTTYHITYISPLPSKLSQLKGLIDGRLSDINKAMSTYDPNSEISKINQSAPNIAHLLSADFYRVLTQSLALSQRTGGALDVTIGHLVNRWGFGPDNQRPLPSAIEVAELLRACGSNRLTVMAANQSLIKLTPLYLDLSSTAKGYAVDEVARVLETEGIINYLVEIGGEIRAHGRKPGDQPWRVGIEKPLDDARSIHQIISLGNQSLATSGDYRNFHKMGTKRLSHIIDPRTGFPVNHPTASVTVLAATALEADGIATALLVMGSEKGMAWADAQGVGALFINRSSGGFETITSKSFPTQLASRTH